jgi:hypothetical protein
MGIFWRIMLIGNVLGWGFGWGFFGGESPCGDWGDREILDRISGFQDFRIYRMLKLVLGSG